MKIRHILLASLLAFILAAPSHAQTLKVLTKPIEPFVSETGGKPAGFSIELWDLIAEERGWTTQYVMVPTLTDLLDGIKAGQADAAIAAVSITAEREKFVDFSHPYFRSGLQIMTSGQDSEGGIQIWGAVRDLFFSKGFAIASFIFLLSVILVSHVTWWLERKHNEQFSPRYPHGVWDAFWWAIVTITTVGYGDKAPKALSGRLFALFWMIFGYFMFAYFTAVVTSTVTVQELRGTIGGPDDLYGRKVAVIDNSTSAKFFTRRGQAGDLVPVDRIEDAYNLLSEGKVEAIVHDAPVLQYHVQRTGKNNARLVGPVFNNDEYGVVLPRGSDLREQVNLSILNLRENGAYQRLYGKWFGDVR